MKISNCWYLIWILLISQSISANARKIKPKPVAITTKTTTKATTTTTRTIIIPTTTIDSTPVYTPPTCPHTGDACGTDGVGTMCWGANLAFCLNGTSFYSSSFFWGVLSFHLSFYFHFFIIFLIIRYKSNHSAKRMINHLN